MSFVRNAWYVAGWSTDFGDELVPLTLLAQNLVAYRTSDGQIACSKIAARTGCCRCPRASASATPFNAAITV